MPTYEVRVLIHTDRDLTDDEERAIGDVFHGVERDVGEIVKASRPTLTLLRAVEAHGPKRTVIA